MKTCIYTTEWHISAIGSVSGCWYKFMIMIQKDSVSWPLPAQDEQDKRALQDGLSKPV